MSGRVPARRFWQPCGGSRHRAYDRPSQIGRHCGPTGRHRVRAVSTPPNRCVSDKAKSKGLRSCFPPACCGRLRAVEEGRPVICLPTAIALATAAVRGVAGAAQSRVEVGVLECRGTTASFIVGSVTDLRCTFRPRIAAGALSRVIRRVGVDIGFGQQVAVAWAVFAPTRRSAAAIWRQLRRRGRERHGGSRRRRQCAGWRLQQHHRVAAAERAGPDRAERRGRRCRPGIAPAGR